MSFFKNLLGKDEPFVPTPVQQIPGLEPIVVHVVETLFSEEDQKQVFKDLLEKSKIFTHDTTLILLCLLRNCEGEMDAFRRSMESTVDDSSSMWIMRENGIANMKQAEKWVKSLKTFVKEEPFVPTPTQNIPGLEPIVVQVVETLFSNTEEQKEVFKDLLEKSEIFSTKSFSRDTTLMLLCLLRNCEGRMEAFRKSMNKTTDYDYSYWLDIRVEHRLYGMKDAEKWVKSIINS